MTSELTQAEIDILRKMKKECAEARSFQYPLNGEKLSIPLVSENKREEFMLDINRSSIDIAKISHLNRARRSIVLLRLDLGGRPHRNPDGTEVASPHLHIYKEGFGDKYAIPLPQEFANCSSLIEYLEKFMDYCNIIKKPDIAMGLFV